MPISAQRRRSTATQDLETDRLIIQVECRRIGCRSTRCCATALSLIRPSPVDQSEIEIYLNILDTPRASPLAPSLRPRHRRHLVSQKPVDALHRLAQLVERAGIGKAQIPFAIFAEARARD